MKPFYQKQIDFQQVYWQMQMSKSKSYPIYRMKWQPSLFAPRLNPQQERKHFIKIGQNYTPQRSSPRKPCLSNNLNKKQPEGQFTWLTQIEQQDQIPGLNKRAKNLERTMNMRSIYDDDQWDDIDRCAWWWEDMTRKEREQERKSIHEFCGMYESLKRKYPGKSFDWIYSKFEEIREARQ